MTLIVENEHKTYYCDWKECEYYGSHCDTYDVKTCDCGSKRIFDCKCNKVIICQDMFDLSKEYEPDTHLCSSCYKEYKEERRQFETKAKLDYWNSLPESMRNQIKNLVR